MACSNPPFARLCGLKTEPGSSWNGLSCQDTICQNYTHTNAADPSQGYVLIAKGPYTGSTFQVQGGNANQKFFCPAQNTAIKLTPTQIICKPTVSATSGNNSLCPECLAKKIDKTEQGAVGVGDPVNAGAGKKFDKVTDYLYNSTYPLTFTRIHNMFTDGNVCKKQFDLYENSSIKYSMSEQCTSRSIELAKACGISLPNGISKVTALSGLYSTQISNPAGLAWQIGAVKNYTIENSSIYKKVLGQ